MTFLQQSFGRLDWRIMAHMQNTLQGKHLQVAIVFAKIIEMNYFVETVTFAGCKSWSCAALCFTVWTQTQPVGSLQASMLVAWVEA